MTVAGYQTLDEELKRLKTVERPAVIAAIAEARSHGDLSENAEYHAAKERQGWIEGQIAEIEDKIARAQVIDVTKLSGKQVKFGATVSVVDAQPRTPGRVAAVFPPWWDDARVVASAGTAGDIAGAGGASFIVILRGDPATLNQRARTAGAWLLLDPALAGACARPASEPVSS